MSGEYYFGEADGLPAQNYGKLDEACDRAHDDGYDDFNPGDEPELLFDHPKIQAAYIDGWKRAEREEATA